MIVNQSSVIRVITKNSELLWLSPVAAWINICSMFLMFCIIVWVADQYQGGIGGLPIQENIDLMAAELKTKLLIVSLKFDYFDFDKKLRAETFRSS